MIIAYFHFGLGKTLAFGVPAVMHVLRKRNGDMSKGRNPLCLVLSPTRELAQQVCVNHLCAIQGKILVECL